MSDNPFQSPQTESRLVGIVTGRREDLKSVAQYQKGILICILLHILFLILRFVLPGILGLLLIPCILIVGLTGTVFVFLLATKVYSIPLGVLLGILTFIPCIGLLVLLIVNGKATKILQQNGIPVGLLGANLSQFP